MRAKSLCCSLLLATIAGCTSSFAPPPAPHDYDTNTEQSVLDEVAYSIEHSLRVLAMAKKPEITTAINTEPLTSADGGMSEKIRIDWSGPIKPLVQRVADMTDYNLKVLGPEPAIPIIVSVTQKRIQIADILKDAGLQAGSRAHIVVFPKARIIELRYARA